MPTVIGSTKADFDRSEMEKRGQLKPTIEAPHKMGINVKSDKAAGLSYADLIVDGKKAYETRESDSLRPYVNKHMAIVRTGEGDAKAIGSAHIGEPIVVDEKQFRKMGKKHLVPEGSQFDVKPGQKKYLYPITKAQRYDKEYDVAHGIVARKVLPKEQD